jgi:HD-like signal output (HDOD) protein
MERFWDASAKTAGLTAWLTRQLRTRLGIAPEEAYTFALFRDCGIPTLMMPFEDYIAVLACANAEKTRSFTAVEEALIGVNHALIGAQLANDWGLPANMVAAIRWHHDWAALAGESSPPLERASRHLIAVAQVAEFLVQQHYSQTITLEWAKLGPSALADLGLDEIALAQLAAEVKWLPET